MSRIGGSRRRGSSRSRSRGSRRRSRRNTVGGTSGSYQTVPANTTVNPSDAGDSPSDDTVPLGSKSYSTHRFVGETKTCLHCGADFEAEGAYHGEYCEECREPDGFLD